MIKIANVKTFVDDGSIPIRVDRKTDLGNPYTMKNESMRDEVCDKYHKYFYKRLNDFKKDGFKSELAFITAKARSSDITLLCWCYPKRCHAETIRDFVNSELKKRG